MLFIFINREVSEIAFTFFLKQMYEIEAKKCQNFKNCIERNKCDLFCSSHNVFASNKIKIFDLDEKKNHY